MIAKVQRLSSWRGLRHVAYTWRTRVQRKREKFYWFGGARRATSQKKTAVTVGDVFGSSGVRIKSSRKVRVPKDKGNMCGHSKCREKYRK